MNTTSQRTLGLAGLLVAAVLGVSACGSSGGGSAGSAGAATGDAGAAAPSSAKPPTTKAYLTTTKGLALYLFAPDTDGTSHCYGGCATAWPPVPAGTRLATAQGKVDDNLLGTTKRTDGSTQLTYAGHPLYRYAGDAEAGQTTGQGLDTGGGLWWLVAPKGAAITSGGSGSSGDDDGAGSGDDDSSSGNYRY